MLGPFVLIQALAPVMAANAPARVINVTSGGMYTQALRPGDLMSEHDEYNPQTFYARSKRAEVVATEQLATRLAGTGIVVHSMHPGLGRYRRHPARDAGVSHGRRPDLAQRRGGRGHDRLAAAALPEPLQSTGKLWMDRAVRPTHYRFGASPDGVEAREELWNAVRAAR